MKRICVFCGSSSGNDPIYESTARELGNLLVQGSIELVYGGGDVGLMGIISRTVMEGGGKVRGIIPEMLYEKVPHQNITELKVVKDMHERKQVMHELAEGFICLPGGIGSLEELFETLTWLQLGYHSKPVALINVNAYYSYILKQLDKMIEQGFLKREHRAGLLVSESPMGVIDMMEKYHAQYIDKWK